MFFFMFLATNCKYNSTIKSDSIVKAVNFFRGSFLEPLAIEMVTVLVSRMRSHKSVSCVYYDRKVVSMR